MVSKNLTNIFCRNINIFIASLQRECELHLHDCLLLYPSYRNWQFLARKFSTVICLKQPYANVYQNMTQPQMMAKWLKYAMQCQKVNLKFLLMIILFWNLSIILGFDIKTTTLWQKGLLTSSGRQAM